MNINIEHPLSDVDRVRKSVDNGELIRASPHIGSLDQSTNPHYLALGSMGVQLEMVNTCTVDDRNGQPTLIVKNGQVLEIVGMSRKEKKALLPVGVLLSDGTSLESFHLDATQDSVERARTSTEFLASLGTETMKQGEVMQALAKACDTLMRLSEAGRVSGDPTKRLNANSMDEKGLFGMGDDPSSGLIVPVQAMMAGEIIEATLRGHDTITHIGGADMVEYTRDASVMDPICDIASKALASLGIQAPTSLRYVVLDKNNGIAGLPTLSKRIAEEVGLENFSQHDTIGRNLYAELPKEMSA